jgi:hypothetical protein
MEHVDIVVAISTTTLRESALIFLGCLYTPSPIKPAPTAVHGGVSRALARERWGLNDAIVAPLMRLPSIRARRRS